MKIVNRTKIYKNKEISDCINLLNKKYRNLNCKVFIIENKFKFLLKNILNFLFLDTPIGKNFKEALDGHIFGSHFQDENKIEIYAFNYKNQQMEEKKLNILYCILHEVRHNYQKEYFKIKFPKSSQNYINPHENQKKYLNQWIEKDANGFAKHTMKKFKKEISKILNISEDWDLK